MEPENPAQEVVAPVNQERPVEPTRYLEAIPFKDFLDKSNNLISIFGVCNALFIYAGTLNNKDAAEFLLPTLFIMGMLVWLELIFFCSRSNDGSWKYKVFAFLLAMVEYGLVIYFFKAFKGLWFSILLFAGFIGYTILFSWLISLPVRPFKKKWSLRRWNNFLFVVVMLVMLSSLFTMRPLSPIVGKFADLVFDDSAKLPISLDPAYRKQSQTLGPYEKYPFGTIQPALEQNTPNEIITGIDSVFVSERLTYPQTIIYFRTNKGERSFLIKHKFKTMVAKGYLPSGAHACVRMSFSSYGATTTCAGAGCTLVIDSVALVRHTRPYALNDTSDSKKSLPCPELR